MIDLIDRQAAISEIVEYADRLQMVNWKENPGVPYKAYTLNWCVNTIRDLPSADAVEVVRCKDCKYRDADDFCTGRGYPNVLVPDDGFCDKGERRE